MIILTDDEKLSNEDIYSYIGKINGIVYVRVSTTDQAKHGYSLESQIERCVDRAKIKFNMTEDEIIVLIEAGASGDDPNRPALNYALYLLEKGIGKKLFILHPDRLTRDNTLQGVLSRKIWNFGVDIEFIEFEVDPTNPESMLMYNIQGSIAQYNKAKILANSKRGRITKAKKGELPSFKRLYGYTYNKETDKLEINKEEQEIIEYMIEMVLNKDTSCNQLAKELSKRGIPAPSGNVWYQTTVTRILRNEVYLGTYYFGQSQVIQKDGKKIQIPKPREEWIGISIPQLIDEVTFQKLQDKISEFTKGKGRKSKDYLLKGICRCGRCGSAAGSGITSKVKSGVYKYYACRMKASKGYEVGSGENVHKCEGRNWRVDLVDEVVWNEVLKIFKDPQQISKMFLDMNRDSKALDTLTRTKKKIEEELKEIDTEETSYILLFGKQKITEEQFDKFTEPLKNKKDSLQEDLKIIINQLVSFERNKDEVKIIQDYVEKIGKTLTHDLDVSEKKKIVKMLIERVILHEDNRIEIIWAFGGINPDDSHKKQVNVQEQGINFYVSFKVDLPESEYMNGEYEYTWQKHIDKMDKMLEMNHKQLLNINQMQIQTGILSDDIKMIFKHHNQKLYNEWDIAKLKREKDFNLLYDLHFKKKLSLNEIYRDYNYSQPYVKRVFREKGLSHLGFVNQVK